MNRVMLIGRLTAKPELRYTASNVPFARFSVAVNRTFSNAQGQRETDFINVIVWRKQAENTCNYLDKGSLVSIEGRLQTGSYGDKDGNKRTTYEVVVNNAHFVENKRDSGNAGGFAPAETQAAPQSFSNSDSGDFSEIASDDDLPF